MAAATPSFPRTGVTSADADASTLAPTIVIGKSAVRVGATCTSSTPNAILDLSLYFLDQNSQPTAVARFQLAAGPVPDWGSNFVATAVNLDPCWPLGGADYVVLKVDSLSPGSTWSIGAAIG